MQVSAQQRPRFDAIEMLEADHVKVMKLFGEYEKARPVEKPEIAERIFAELEIHTMLEDKIFYPTLESRTKSEARKLAGDARIGNAEVRMLVAELRTLDPRGHKYETRLRTLRDDVEHHIREEEEEMFPLAERVLSVGSMGEEMHELRMLHT